ncbi:MAG: hypothetical protein JWN04_545 [Myxococcaceae bacterium]|nr:hypothetical protein [Myxococcaceae bacterium]
MATKSPLSIVKERFQDKDGLLKAVRELVTEDLWIDRLDASKGLDAVSNKKLLRLHLILSDVKSKFGSRDKLVEAIMGHDGRGKDQGRKEGLGRLSTPRLYDLYKTGAKKAKAAAKA